MPVLKLSAEEIKLLRKTLKMSEAEFANRIELEDRQEVKLLESGGLVPSVKMNRLLLRLLGNGATRSPKLKKMLESLKERSQQRWT
jgi:DNA-binding transcriptional regulator YiaG